MTPEQHANTEAFRRWALAEDRPDAGWIIARKDARELVALAERADTLERERDEARLVEQRLYNEGVRLREERDKAIHERGVACDWAAELAGKVAQARAEADRLRAALEEAHEAIDREWRGHLNEADESEDDGSHIGFARHHRAVATGLGDALKILSATLVHAPSGPLEVGRLRAALLALGWDVGEDEPCWCDEGRFDSDEPGVPRFENPADHSDGCRGARAALAGPQTKERGDS